jgi:hypothetical protein
LKEKLDLGIQGKPFEGDHKDPVELRREQVQSAGLTIFLGRATAHYVAEASTTQTAQSPTLGSDPTAEDSDRPSGACFKSAPMEAISRLDGNFAYFVEV